MFFSLLLGLLPANASAAPSAETAPFPVTGNIMAHVYRDFNGNGTRESGGALPETGVGGVQLTLYDAGGALVATGMTNVNGDVGLAALLFTGKPGPYRAEFTNLPAGYMPSGVAGGTQNGTTVQFILDDAVASRDLMLGVLIPSDYSALGADPLVAVPAMAGGNNSALDAHTGIVTGAYSVIADTATKSIAATNVQVGSVWGQAWQASENRLFTGAYAKRHTGFGPQGPGGVYVTDFTNPASPTLKSFTLQGVAPANGGAAIDLGSINRSSESDYILPPDPITWSVDLDAFGKIGKVAYGDVDVDFTGVRLWLVNLNQRALISLDISSPVTNGVVPGAANQYLLANASGIPSCAGTIRPFGLEFYGETGYLGVVCDANNGGARDSANLRGYVLSFTPPALGDTATTALAFSTALEIPMNYRDSKGETAEGPRRNSEEDPLITPASVEYGDRYTSEWQPWADTYDQTLDRGYTFLDSVYTRRRSYAQPVVSDIEIDPTGNMTIGILNRWGDQMGVLQLPPVPGGVASPSGNPRRDVSVNNAGDTLKACLVSGTYVLEGPAGCPEYDGGLATTGTNNTLGLNTDGFNGGGEFYWGDTFYTGQGTHWENTSGGLGMWPGKREVLSNAFDPITTSGSPFANVFSNGVSKLSMNNGSKIAGWQVLPENRGDLSLQQAGAYFGKANAMGDIEILNAAAPIEIGNRIWEDLDGDGIQDPNEDPIAGVTVTLWADTNGDGTVDTQVGTTVTNADGEWYFGGLNDVNMTGGNSVLPYTAYEVRVDTTQAALSGMTATQENAPQPANGDASATDNDPVTDVADSDAVMRGATAVIAYATGPAGENNHGLDMGFHAPTASVGNYVWLDENNDGYQDAGERGIPNVEVTLTPPANIDLGNGLGQPITTMTDSHGGYLFDDLPPGDYTVTVNESTLPTTGMTQTPTSTVDSDGDGVADDGDFGNKPNGYTVSLVAGEENLTADFGYNYNTDAEVNNPAGSPSAALGDRVWIDSDGDGKQDPNEVGVEGVEVTLYTAGPDGIFGTADDVAAETTMTDANGYYIFDNLTPGAYAVGVTGTGSASHDVLGGGYTQTGDPDHFGTTGTNNDNYSEPIVLGPGDVFLNADFGYQPDTAVLNSIGDTIFYDVDADGNGPGMPNVDEQPGGAAVTQGAGGTADSIDYGIAGVTVSLIDDLNGNGVWDAGEPIIATDVTDANGQYLFDDLPDGDYIVWVNDTDGVLSGLSQSYDADGTGTPNISAVTSLSGGTDVRNQDFGYTNNQPGATTGTIGDTVWYDLNNNGVQDSNEVGIPGVEVTVCALSDNLALNKPATASDSHASSTPSDANDGNRDGLYSNGSVWTANNGSPTSTWWQVDLGSIEYMTRIDLYNRTDSSATQARLSNAWVLVADTDFSTDPNLDTLAEAIQNANYAYQLGDMSATAIEQLFTSTSGRYLRVWGDTTPYLNLAEVEVYNETCQTTVTDENGKYLFTGLPVDADGVEYTVTVNSATLPGGLTQTHDASGALDNSSTTTISTADPIDLDQDFGYRAAGDVGSIGNRVWLDQDADGIWDGDAGTAGVVDTDGDEPGIAGITIDLYQDLNGNGVVDPGEPLMGTTTTDANGNYLFDNLPYGHYVVDVTDEAGLLAGYWHSLGTDGVYAGDPAADSQDHSKTDPVAVSIGVDSLLDGDSTPEPANNLNVDFGYYVEPAAVGNYVWVDLDGNGVQDPSEPPIEGVEVKMVITYPDGTITTLVTKTDATGYYSFPNLLLDEDYNGDGSGPEPTFTISVDPNQDVLLTLTETQVNSDNGTTVTNVTNDSNLHSGTLAQPVQGLTDTTVDTADIASYDFGYKAVLALGGTLWNDYTGSGDGAGTANDGVYQVGEEVLDGVTVKLYAANPDGSLGAPVDDPRNPGTPYSVVTDANGAYLFDGLAPGDYIVVIEDFATQTELTYSTLGALDPDDSTAGDKDTGLENGTAVQSAPITLEALVQATADGSEPDGERENGLYSTLLTTSQDGRMNYNVDLGFTDTPLAVSLSYAYAERGDDGTVTFIWETATETGNAGFNLYMEFADGSPQLVNSELVPSSVIDSVTPTRYIYQANVAGERYTIELVSVAGAAERHGPYALGREYGEPADADHGTLTNPLYLPLIRSR